MTPETRRTAASDPLGFCVNEDDPAQAPRRARPLPPDERRAKLIAATLPLVAEHGTRVTTRQIAEAAGVAEGTIFRVFPDKDALVHAAVQAALDPQPTLDDLVAIDAALPLADRLTRIAEILQERFLQAFNLLIAVRMHAPPGTGAPHGQRPAPPSHEAIYDTIIQLLEPDRDQFRYSLAEVARMLRLLTFSGTHPMITEGRPLAPEEIASVLLDGVRRRSPQS